MEDQFSLSMRGFKGPVPDLKERKNMVSSSNMEASGIP